MTRQLPLATEDLDRAAADLAQHGYCLVRDALTSRQVTDLRAQLVEAAFAEVDLGIACIDAGGANQRVWRLLNHGPDFVALAEHPAALALMTGLLGTHRNPKTGGDHLPDFLLTSLTANIAGPGGQRMAVHQDQGYVPHPWPPYPFVANVAWMLDDTTSANGATRVVPDSHLLDGPPDPDAASRAIAVEGAAGTAMVFDGRLWHGTGSNSTVDQKRHVILAAYCKPWLRTQENHALGLRPDVTAGASPTVRRLLGLDLWGALGSVTGLRRSDFGDPDPAPAAHHRRGWVAPSPSA